MREALHKVADECPPPIPRLTTEKGSTVCLACPELSGKYSREPCKKHIYSLVAEIQPCGPYNKVFRPLHKGVQCCFFAADND